MTAQLVESQWRYRTPCAGDGEKLVLYLAALGGRASRLCYEIKKAITKFM